MTDETTAPVADEDRDAAARLFLEDEDAEPSSLYDGQLYESGSREWLILTDEEADARAVASIRESVWAFRPEFLVRFMPEGITEEILTMIAEAKCEGATEPFLAMIGDDFDEFASEAISADGRGHFLAGYDHEEHEFEQGDQTWYAYRTN